MLYVDPLGKVTDLNSKLNEKLVPIGTDPLYNYSNKINNLKKNHVLTNARLEDIEKKMLQIKLIL